MSDIIEKSNYYMNEILDMTGTCPNYQIIDNGRHSTEYRLSNGIIVKIEVLGSVIGVDFWHEITKFATRNKKEFATITKVFDLMYCNVLSKTPIYTIRFAVSRIADDVISVNDKFVTYCLQELTPNDGISNQIMDKLTTDGILYRSEFDAICDAMQKRGALMGNLLNGTKNFKVVTSQRADIYEKALRKNFKHNDFTKTVEGNFFLFTSPTRII